MNTRYKRKKFYTPSFVQPHIRWDKAHKHCGTHVSEEMFSCYCAVSKLFILSGRLRIEKHLRKKARKANLEKQTQAKLKEKFPHMKVSSSWNSNQVFHSKVVCRVWMHSSVQIMYSLKKSELFCPMSTHVKNMFIYWNYVVKQMWKF